MKIGALGSAPELLFRFTVAAVVIGYAFGMAIADSTAQGDWRAARDAANVTAAPGPKLTDQIGLATSVLFATGSSISFLGACLALRHCIWPAGQPNRTKPEPVVVVENPSYTGAETGFSGY